jgi:hypothetical protein
MKNLDNKSCCHPPVHIIFCRFYWINGSIITHLLLCYLTHERWEITNSSIAVHICVWSNFSNPSLVEKKVLLTSFEMPHNATVDYKTKSRALWIFGSTVTCRRSYFHRMCSFVAAASNIIVTNHFCRNQKKKQNCSSNKLLYNSSIKQYNDHLYYY